MKVLDQTPDGNRVLIGSAAPVASGLLPRTPLSPDAAPRSVVHTSDDPPQPVAKTGHTETNSMPSKTDIKKIFKSEIFGKTAGKRTGWEPGKLQPGGRCPWHTGRPRDGLAACPGKKFAISEFFGERAEK